MKTEYNRRTIEEQTAFNTARGEGGGKEGQGAEKGREKKKIRACVRMSGFFRIFAA
ncbi:MAG: hypothetical protein J6X88_08720 [Bacteroidales bacterium]|nr:hypothetical protein [Bacteroidales bacterium]